MATACFCRKRAGFRLRGAVNAPTPESHRFADRLGSWVATEGPDSDVVVSCRTRLARNVDGFPFVSKLDPERAQEVEGALREALGDDQLDGETHWVTIAEAPVLLRLLLRERHLVSRDLAPSDDRRPLLPGRAVAFGSTETLSAMINEEDHLRLQGFSSGFDFPGAWERVRDLDRALEGRLRYAYSTNLGYLTGCPTNVGTGLRASVMLHLPGLGLVRSELEKVFQAAQRTGLAVRGMYGEGSRAVGDYYQISNQVTLGRTEAQLIGDLQALVPNIVDFERRVRDVLVSEQRQALEERVQRSFASLRTARAMPTEVGLGHLSNVRLGRCLGLLPNVSLTGLSALAIQIQKGHVQALSQGSPDGHLLEVSERDRLRAALLRRRFADTL